MHGSPTEEMVPAEFIRFAAVGGVAALVNWGSCLALSASIPLGIAVIPAYGAGMATSFTLSKFLVFASSGRTVRSELWRFTLVNGVSFVQVWIVTMGLVDFLFPTLGFSWHIDAVAHAIGVASPIMTSFLAHKHFTFRQADASPR